MAKDRERRSSRRSKCDDSDKKSSHSLSSFAKLASSEAFRDSSSYEMSPPVSEQRSGAENKDNSKASAVDYSYMSSEFASSSEVMPDSLKNFRDIQRLAHASKSVRKMTEEIRPEQNSSRKNNPQRQETMPAEPV